MSVVKTSGGKFRVRLWGIVVGYFRDESTAREINDAFIREFRKDRARLQRAIVNEWKRRENWDSLAHDAREPRSERVVRVWLDGKSDAKHEFYIGKRKPKIRINKKGEAEWII